MYLKYTAILHDNLFILNGDPAQFPVSQPREEAQADTCQLLFFFFFLELAYLLYVVELARRC